MQSVGKLDGPDPRVETTLDYIFILIVFSIRAAITSLDYIRIFLTIYNMIHSIMWIERTRDELILQIAQWLIFVIWLFFTSAFGRIVWSIILIPFYTLFGGPIALYAFFKSVYDFGPEHCQRSL